MIDPIHMDYDGEHYLLTRVGDLWVTTCLRTRDKRKRCNGMIWLDQNGRAVDDKQWMDAFNARIKQYYRRCTPTPRPARNFGNRYRLPVGQRGVAKRAREPEGRAE